MVSSSGGSLCQSSRRNCPRCCQSVSAGCFSGVGIRFVVWTAVIDHVLEACGRGGVSVKMH